jgi:hypothetical protein
VLVGGVVAPEAPVAGIEGPVAGGVAGAPTVAGMKGNCDIGLLVGELCPLSSPISPGDDEFESDDSICISI